MKSFENAACWWNYRLRLRRLISGAAGGTSGIFESLPSFKVTFLTLVLFGLSVVQQGSVTASCACPWPAATSPRASTPTQTRLTTTTWSTSRWHRRTSAWRSLLSFKTGALLSHRVPSRLSCSSQIPLLQRAQAMSPQPLRLLASAWSAPAWMKTNGALIGKGSLKGQPGGKEHKAWAQYYIRWLRINEFYLKGKSNAAKINALNAPLNPLSGSWRNMLNITSPSGHWLQEMSRLLDKWQTTGLSSEL